MDSLGGAAGEFSNSVASSQYNATKPLMPKKGTVQERNTSTKAEGCRLAQTCTGRARWDRRFAIRET